MVNLASRMRKTKNNTVTNADIIDGKLVIGRYDGSQLEVPMGGTDSWLQVTRTANFAVPLDTNNVFVPFTDASDPPPRGTGVTWDVGTPTEIVIEEAGKYDVAFSLLASSPAGGGVLMSYIQLNDDGVGPFYYWQARSVLQPAESAAAPWTPVMTIPGVALSQGDVLKLLVHYASPGIDDAVIVSSAVMISSS